MNSFWNVCQQLMAERLHPKRILTQIIITLTMKALKMQILSATTLASYYEIIPDQKNNLLAILIRYQCGHIPT